MLWEYVTRLTLGCIRSSSRIDTPRPWHRGLLLEAVAQALLKVKLERIFGTLDRTLEAISRDSQIFSEADRGAGQAVGDNSKAAQET